MNNKKEDKKLPTFLKFFLTRRALLVFALAAIAIWFFYSGAHESFTFEKLKQSQTQLRNWYQENPVQSIATFVLMYIGMMSVYLPGPSILTLAAGGVFGFWVGLVLVSLASATGAFVAFIVARFLLRDFVCRKFRTTIDKINEGVEREGWLYLLSLRLMPGVPFFMVNLASGVTSISKRAYFLTTFLGMIPGHIVFLYAGSQLRRVQDPSEVLTWDIILLLVAMSFLPLGIKKILPKRKVSLGKYSQKAHQN